MYMIGDDKIAKQNYSVARDVTQNREDSRFFLAYSFLWSSAKKHPPVLPVGKIKSFSKIKLPSLEQGKKALE